MCRAMPPFFTLISMRATRRSSSETIRSSAREECNHAGAPPHPAHVHALSADAPRRGLTRRDCGRLRLSQTRRPRPARTDRVERPRDSPIRAERRVPITRRTRRLPVPVVPFWDTRECVGDSPEVSDNPLQFLRRRSRSCHCRASTGGSERSPAVASGRSNASVISVDARLCSVSDGDCATFAT